MSRANVDLTHRVVCAFNGRDIDALSALVTDDFEWITPTADGADTKIYRGRGGIRQFFEDASVWEVIEDHVDEVLDFGDRMLVLGEVRWRDGRGGFLELGAPLAALLYVQHGKLARIQTYRAASEALEAAEGSGMSECSAQKRAYATLSVA